MPLEIPEHRHCQMCGKAIPQNEIFCSQECKEKFEKFVRRRRILLLIMYAIIMAIFLAVVLVNL
ncbi:MAG TPA: DUF2116 family Zn-ribbon domain-containing protein [Thermoplasmatales archaeon]|nr:DUF2116 family Zn-ribbon domain-containing protein [Thermoplasmatales archaeon]